MPSRPEPGARGAVGRAAADVQNIGPHARHGPAGREPLLLSPASDGVERGARSVAMRATSGSWKPLPRGVPLSLVVQSDTGRPVRRPQRPAHPPERLTSPAPGGLPAAVMVGT